MMFNFGVNQHLFLALPPADSQPLVKGDARDEAQASHGPVGTVFTKSRRTRSRAPYRETARERLRSVRPGSGNATVQSRNSAKTRTHVVQQGDRRRLELAYSLMMTLPGTPVIRYGDEIGMGDNLKLPERNCARTPMQWSTEPNAGSAQSDDPCQPVISNGPYGFPHTNVAAQRRDPTSLLNWMERLIRMRKEVPEIGWGDFPFVSTGTPNVLAMRYEWRNNSVLCVHNLSAEPHEVRDPVSC